MHILSDTVGEYYFTRRSCAKHEESDAQGERGAEARVLTPKKNYGPDGAQTGNTFPIDGRPKFPGS
jgi:hypothetical protein